MRDRIISGDLVITHLKTQDADELAEFAFAQGWDEEYIQLKKGKFEIEISFIQVGGYQFIERSCSSALLYRGRSPTKTFVIAIPTINIGKIIYGGNNLSENCCLTGNSAGFLDLRTMNQSRFLMMVVPMEQIIARSEQMQFPLTQRQLLSPGIIVSNLKALKQFSNYLEQLFIIGKNHPQILTDNTQKTSMANLIIEDSLPLLLNVLTSKLNFLPEKESNRQQLINRAEELIRSDLANPLTLTDLCQGLNTSQRALYYAFQECIGLPPMEYLKRLRLYGVRRTLRKSDSQINTVTELAIKFGFWHMGQFSADYKKMFGETPSITLKRNE